MYLNFSNEIIDIINQDLENLKLEFELEETGINPESFMESKIRGKEFYCCCITNENSIQEENVQSKNL